jgi:hypothetical protein
MSFGLVPESLAPHISAPPAAIGKMVTIGRAVGPAPK